ncbi:hypothetical protein OG2516_00519 [Oceanicola granulosus HTCC2516]|uniref:DUF885 domain-containing protein n=1 Tax=Oceanicola granulosus (strain ATCC BAA-861 / DSM 15982 / KCTC 12143 / HTCC2516) TaxID=314256 RepID=Q2CJD6_OCEGH|nr:hypothetical protein [Oceanicola granulosus]EAR52664.1 hypothetical protein OG2516_00519 [Oceanicola granulosus HTCC2516]
MNLSKITYDLTAVTMGIHGLERQRNDGNSLLDGEGLVPIYTGGDLVVPRRYQDWETVRRDLTQLQDAVEKIAPGERRTFFEGMIGSLLIAVRLFSGGSPTYEQKVIGLVGAARGHEDAGMIAASHDRIDRLLTRLGFRRGTLADRVRLWEDERAVPEHKLDAVLAELMEEAKRRTDEMIFDTGDFSMEIRPVRDVPYPAWCGFAERRVDLNVEMMFSRAALKHIICHNIYPGHATQTLYAHAEVTAGRSTFDALLTSANAVTGCVQEGIGDQGIYLIDWMEDEDDELTAELRNLRSACQTSATWAYMAEGQPAEQTVKYLRDTALGQDAWVRGRLRSAAHPFKGPFAASFWAGNEVVRRVRERVSDANRPDFIRYLYGRAHSPQSLEMYRAA